MNNLFKYHYLNIVTSSIYFLKSLQDMTFLQLSLVTWRKKNNIAVKNRFDSLPAIKSIWFRVESFSLGSRLGRGPRRRLGPEYEQHVLTCLKNPTDLLKYLDDVSPSLLDWVGSPQYIHLYQYKRCFKIIPWTSGGASTFWFFRRSMCSTACEGKKKPSSIIIIMLSYKSFMWNFHIF